MKKSIVISMVLMAILALGMSACSNPTTPTVQENSSSSGSSASTPTPVISVNSEVTASGFVAAEQKARMAFKLPGNVKLVQIKTGDHVQAGQVLVQLDDASQQIQLEQANMALEQLTSPAALAIAEQTVAQDQQDLDNAQASLNNQLYYSTNGGAIKNAMASLTLAKDQLDKVQTLYDNTPGDPQKDAMKAAVYQKLYAAKQAVKSATYQYNWWTGKPNQKLIDLKTAQLALAKAKLVEDQMLVNVLRGDPIPDNATGSGMAQLRQARLNVDIAQANLDATRLVAPFAGEVGSVTVSAGDYVSPGQPILVVSDNNPMHIETTDLSERDIPAVKVGQNVTVTIKALNQDVKGIVSAISPVSDTLGGDVVYKVNITLDGLPADLREGMSVDVLFDTSS